MGDTVIALSASADDTTPLRYADMDGYAPAATFDLVEAASRLGRESGATRARRPDRHERLFYDPDLDERAAVEAPRPPRHRDGGGDALHHRRRARASRRWR